MFADEYFKKIRKIINDIEAEEKDNIKRAADLFLETIDNEGIIHVFGSAHSSMMAMEVFYRAGGMALMNPIFDPGVMIENGGYRSTKVERMKGYGDIILTNYELEEKDLMIVFSNSGRNPVPIEVAFSAREKGLKVMAVTSIDYSSQTESRHESGKRLFEIADLVLDNQTPYGDALLDYGEIKAVPGSTIAAALIINSIIAETLFQLKEKNEELPVFLSGNIDKADKHNRRMIEKYGKRIRNL